MARLDRIRIAGYKSIRDQTIELRDLNVLIGANGAGKSNLLDVFSFLRLFALESGLGGEVGARGGAQRLLFFGPKVSSGLRFILDFSEFQYSAELRSTEQNGLIFNLEEIDIEGPRWKAGTGRMVSALVSWPPDEVEVRHLADQVRQALSQLRVYHFNDTSRFSAVRLGGDYLADNLQLHSDASNLASVLHRFEREFPAQYQNLVDTIRLVAPFLESLVLEPEHESEMVSLRWKHRGTEEVFPSSALSDGTLRFICLAAVLLQPRLPKILLLDEPELGLHPAAIEVLAALVQKASLSCQVIVATQSVTLLNQFTAEDILVVERQGEESVFRRQSPEDLASWLEDYSVGELWEKNVLGGRPAA